MIEIIFNSTQKFERDLENFESKERMEIVERVNMVAQAFVHDKNVFVRLARKPFAVELPNGYDSSLYAVRVVGDLRLILTIENDPLFDRVVVTLLRAVCNQNLREPWEETVKALYGHSSLLPKTKMRLGKGKKQKVPVG